jgi:hypothetical protein
VLARVGRRRVADPGFSTLPRRPRRACRGVSRAGLGDRSVAGRVGTGLAHPGVETEVADQLVRGAERSRAPTAATIDRATIASTPRMLISRVTSSRPSATRARSASIRASSSPSKSSYRSSASAVVRSSGGSCWSVSHTRPLIPNRSLAGQRTTRLRCRIAWTWFFSRVRCRTICAAQHLATQRAGRRVGQPHRRQKVRGQQPSQNLGVDLVGLDLRLGDHPGS